LRNSPYYLKVILVF